MVRARMTMLHCIEHLGTHNPKLGNSYLIMVQISMQRNEFDRTALGYAAIEGHVEFARRLLEHGPVIDARDIGDEVPLHFAVEYGETQVTQLLLEHGADVNARGKLFLTPSQLGSCGRNQEIQ